VSFSLNMMGGNTFAQHGHTGKGVVIAILDAGFSGADSHEAFRQLGLNGQIRATYDFVGKTSDVYHCKSDHGTEVFSCIAGKMGGKNMGFAPDATFLLARIMKEYGNEFRGEENFVAGVEWSDKNGATLINSSAGPNDFEYMPEEMDGKTALISRAANLAARKGMLVIAAAGNEGGTRDENLLPPADSDSVLAVTAVNDTGFIADYSSVGPVFDFRTRKPDVCAPGTAIVAYGDNEYGIGDGTSFSCPFVVGFAACLVEMYPDITPLGLMDTLRHSGSLYPYFDYAHGNGIPQASYFFDPPGAMPETFSFGTHDSYTDIIIDDNFMPDCCRKMPTLLFYNLETASGKIYRYGVIEVRSKKPLSIDNLQDVTPGTKLNVSYKGYYASKVF
ncbi:MAG TPA: S8 family serine peptidase, partial [Bacteroidia bacterium]|nr:S8 family serine peptidase [Bacteroidia bacterium]